MAYGNKIRSMNDKELARFLSQCVIPEDDSRDMFICGVGHFGWVEDLADKLGDESEGKMSKTTMICCSRCGRDLYTPISFGKREPKHIEYYVIPADGAWETELCKECFEQWVKENIK